MIEIVMVRHPQATPGEEPLRAPLTPLGRAQATAVGEHLARLGFRADQLWTGPGRRHRDAAALIMEVLAGYPPNEPLIGLGDGPAGESAAALEARVRRAMAEIQADAVREEARQVLAIASAPPLAAAALTALGAPMSAAAALAARTPHGAITRLTLDPAAGAPALVTLNAFDFLRIGEDNETNALTYS